MHNVSDRAKVYFKGRPILVPPSMRFMGPGAVIPAAVNTYAVLTDLPAKTGRKGKAATVASVHFASSGEAVWGGTQPVCMENSDS